MPSTFAQRSELRGHRSSLDMAAALGSTIHSPIMNGSGTSVLCRIDVSADLDACVRASHTSLQVAGLSSSSQITGSFSSVSATDT
ncbi:hypothetical protein AWB80_06219 [Caballeronia pedi]|uniref:Uncharacterized protein n=1 Tax=Caballeronia pedi TaxID=1777141 RepID=A0A158D2U1_9BURK|nr:hypothetical protein AWB80_06219 [Caballeronia pedi]